jgi:hypothetical protein
MFLGKLYLRTIQKMFPQFSGKLKELSLKNQQEVFDKMVELSEKLAFVNKFININDLNKKLQLTEIEKITFFSDEVISDEDIIYFADSVFIVRAENEKLLKRMAKVSPTNWDRIIGVTISYEGEKVEDIVKTIEKLVC